MITLFFIMAISVALGVSLKQVNDATKATQKQNFLLQESVILDDVLGMLKKSTDLDAITQEESPEALSTFLAMAGFLPLSSSGIDVLIELKSARSKLNVNSLASLDGVRKVPRVEALRNFLLLYDVNRQYVEILLDNMGKVKPDNSYNSDIFSEKPYLFRDYISSLKHLYEINDFYARTYNENSLEKIEFENLFYFSKLRDEYKLDVNYASEETWRLLVGCDEARAEQLRFGGGAYSKLEDLGLSVEEAASLSAFDVSYYEAKLDVRVRVKRGSTSSNIRFEYDMNTKKGSNFGYEI